MTTVYNDETLKAMLVANGREDLAAEQKFELTDAQVKRYMWHHDELSRRFGDKGAETTSRAVARTLTEGARQQKAAPIQVVNVDMEPIRELTGVLATFFNDMRCVERKVRMYMIALMVAAVMLAAVAAFGQVQTPTIPAVVVDTCNSQVLTAGSRVPVTVDTTGKLCTTTGGGGTGGTSETDNAAFTGGTTAVTPMGAIYDTTPPAITDGRVGAPRMNADRILYTECTAGCAAAADTTGATVAVNALNETAQVTLAGENGVSVFVAVGTLEGTITPEVSYDGGTTWGGAVFINTVTGAVTLTQAFTNPNAATALVIGYVGSITDARVRLSAVVGGTANMTLVSTVTRPFAVTYGSDGTNIKPVKTDTGGAVQVDVESGTLTAVTTITNAVTVTDGAGALNVIVDSGTITAVTAISNALPAGNNNIGDVDVATIAAGNNNIGDVDVASIAAGNNNIGDVDVASSALPTGASTSAKQPALGTAGTASTDVITVQGIASMTPLLATVSDGSGALNVIVDSGTLTAVTTVTTVTTITNAVTVTDGAGALNVIVDSGTITAVTAITNALPAGNNNIGDVDVATIAAGNNNIGDVDVASIAAGNNNIGDVDIASGTLTTVTTVTTVSTLTTLSQLGGVALPVEDVAETAAGVGIYAMGVRRDVAASSAGATGDNTMASYDAIGQMWARLRDPCSGVAKTYVPIDIVTATTVELANSVASEFFYVCSINLVTAGANNVVIAEDDTDGCGSISAGVTGGVTAAEGWNFAANGGLTIGNGNGAVAKTTTAARYLCILTSAAVQLSGSISFVSAP